MQRYFFASFLTFPLLSASALAAPSSGLIVNGSFEAWSGGITPSNQPDRIFNDGSLVVPGWNFAIGLSSDIYRDLAASGATSSWYDAAHLDYMAGSGSFSTLHEGVRQTFTVVPNTWHVLTFKMAPGGINYSGGWIENATIGSSWLVELTGALPSPVSSSFNTNLAHFNASGTTNPLVWTAQSLYFQSDAVGGSVTLTFSAYGDFTHVFLDDVAVWEVPAPPNDDCGTATVISGPGPHPFDNTVASTGTQGQNESACLFGGQTGIANDQWYLWTAGSAGFATLSTCSGIAGGSSDDTKVAVYLGPACPTSAALACNDDAPCGAATTRSTVTWNTVCGQTYLIQLGRSPGAAASFGTFTLQEFGAACGTGTPYCPGDGTGTACPCGNSGAPGNGCANSVNAAGASLSASGAASLLADTLVLAASGMPNSSVLFFQGTSRVNGGLGTVFGDGLRCAGGSVLRLGAKLVVAGSAQYPAPGETPISIQGAISFPGGLRDYQAWYRNSAAYCAPSGFNLTNGLELLWSP